MGIIQDFGELFQSIEKAINPPPPRIPFYEKGTWASLRGKPVITVSPKGIANGLSDIPNDGADFGPDTPNTQTSGIQEAIDYAVANAFFYGGTYRIPEIKLYNGVFNINAPITVGIGNYPTSANFQFIMRGTATNNTAISYSGGSTTSIITIDPNINNIELDGFSISNSSSGTVQHLLYWDSSKGSGSNIFISNNITLGGNNTSLHAVHLNNVYIAQITGLVSPMNPSLYIHGTGFDQGYFYIQGQLWTGGGLDIGNVYYAKLSGIVGTITVSNNSSTTYSVTNLDISNINGGVIINADIYTLFITSSVIHGPSAIEVNANVNQIVLVANSISGALLSSTASGTVTIDVLKIDGLVNIYSVDAFNLSTNISITNFDLKNIPSGTFSTPLPPYSSTDGTSAGTVAMQGILINPQYKKYIITFDGYENDTTTDQTIDFPTAFGSYAVITANNTGLTISATTTGITITAPDNTTAYSGIVIVEGY